MRKTLAVLLPIVVVLLYSTTSRIPEGSVGIAERGGAIEVLRPGFHFHRPFVSPMTIYDVSLPAVGSEIRVALSDGSTYSVGFDISGKLDPAQAPAFHRSAGQKGIDALLKTAAESALAGAAAAKPPADLASGVLESEAARRAGMILASAGVTEVSLKLRPLGAPECLRLAQALAPSRQAGLLRNVVTGILGSGKAGWEAHAAMGLVLESEKDLHAAEREYLDALTMNPAALPPMAQLVTIYSAVGENGKLDRLLEAAIQAQPTSLQHLGWLAMSLLRQDRPREAEQMIDRALAVDPTNILLLNNLGGVQVKQGRLEDAIATFRKALEAKPDDRQSLYNLGVALSAGGRDREALPHLLQAEKTGGGGSPLLKAIAHAYRKTGDARRAAEYERRAGESRVSSEPAP